MSDASNSSDESRSADESRPSNNHHAADHASPAPHGEDGHEHAQEHDCEGMMMETIRIQLVRRTTGSRLQMKSSVRAKTPMRRLFENYSELLSGLYPGWAIESISRFRSVPHSP